MALNDIVEFALLVNTDEDSGIKSVNQPGKPDLKRLKDYIASTRNCRFAETPRMLHHPNDFGNSRSAKG